MVEKLHMARSILRDPAIIQDPHALQDLHGHQSDREPRRMIKEPTVALAQRQTLHEDHGTEITHQASLLQEHEKALDEREHHVCHHPQTLKPACRGTGSAEQNCQLQEREGPLDE